MLTEEQVTLLKKAYYGELPEELADVEESITIKVLRELIDYGFLDGDDESSSSGLLFIKVRITLSGREYMARMNENRYKKNDDILELKPNVNGIGIDLKALYRRLIGK